MGDERIGARKERRMPASERGAVKLAMAGHGADAQMSTLVDDTARIIKAVDIDEPDLLDGAQDHKHDALVTSFPLATGEPLDLQKSPPGVQMITQRPGWTFRA